VWRIWDVYPGSLILIFTHPGTRIPDPKKQQQKRGVKRICCHNFLCSHKFHKIENYFSFEVLKKKIWANFQRIVELFTCSTTGKPTRLFRTKRASLDSV
jgi:DNA-directed RNA polymerase subunit N (RpoN/RPB10)